MTDLESTIANARREALEEAAKLIEDGYPRPGISSKTDKCPHDKFKWEECDECSAWAIRKLAAQSSPSPRSHVLGSQALLDVAAERRRQVEVEGFSPTHDDQYRNDELTRAAMCYLLGNPGSWPWEYRWWKPADRRRNLIKAAALIIAEIERLDRAAATEIQS